MAPGWAVNTSEGAQWEDADGKRDETPTPNARIVDLTDETNPVEYGPMIVIQATRPIYGGEEILLPDYGVAGGTVRELVENRSKRKRKGQTVKNSCVCFLCT